MQLVNSLFPLGGFGVTETAPQNLDAEEYLLGALLLSAKAIDRVAEEVTADDFFRHSHGTIFSTVLALNAAGEPVDAITLIAALEREGKLEAAGGNTRVLELAALAPAAGNARHYARLVHDSARRRRIQTAAQKIEKLVVSGVGDVDELARWAEHELQNAIITSGRGDFTQIGESVDTVVTRIEEAVAAGKQIFGARTGFPDLDATLTGLHPGQLVVVAARPGVGKTVLAQNIAENLADTGTATGFFSLEMSKEELALRSLCRKSKIDLVKLRTGRITNVEAQSLRAIATQLKERPLFVEDDGGITPTELRARARRLKSQHNLGLLVVDYLQLMVSEQAREKKNDEIAGLSRSMKLLAKELAVPIILVSQLNRNTEYRADKRPTLADLRDSGAIEQDADVVIFIYREETYSKVDEAAAGEAELIVAKNRMGAIQTVKLLFLGRRQTFATPALREEDRAA